MKKVIVCMLIFLPFIMEAQSFELAQGTITSTVSDSRSVNFLDINNDGWEDIYISNGLSGGQADLLYINDGTGQLIAVTDMEIVQASNPSDGASFVDYNNDGHVDGMVSSWYGAEDLLYLNNGNGELLYNADAGIAPGSYAETASFGDYNNDGWLDLYITNSNGNNKNFLYKNLQNGKFERIMDHILVNDTKLSRSATWGDFNNDGIPDLFVTNEDNASNDFFIGLGGESYEKYSSGTIVFSQKSSMTNSWGDIDNDGDFDLFVGNSAYFAPQQNQLFRNDADSFEEITDDPVVMANKCSYGSSFGDYDNDGDLDLIVANGFCGSGLSNTLYANQGDGTFVDATDQLTANYAYCSFGVAWGDVNNDGFLDLMVANCKNNTGDTEKVNTLLMNLGNDNHWLELKLTGLESNTSAVGAKIRLKAMINGEAVWQMREVRSQSGYAGQNSLVVHFGLGDASMADSIYIDWPSGTVQVLEQVEANQKLDIEESSTVGVAHAVWADQIHLEVIPNPVVSGTGAKLLVQSKHHLKDAKVVILDSLGRKLGSSQVDISAGNSMLQLPAPSSLSPGVYQVSLLFEESTLAVQMLVK